MPQLRAQNKAEIIDRYVAGDNPKLLALQAGVSVHTIRGWVHAHGAGGYRNARVRNAALDAANAWCRKLEAAGWPVRNRMRRRTLVYVRQALMLALRRERHSLPNIAAGLDLIDHTTVIYGVGEAEACPYRRKLADMIPTATPAQLKAEIASWGRLWKPQSDKSRHADAVLMVDRGFTYMEAAKRLGLTRGQVAGAVHRARGTQEAAS